jgi:hypothetical protein
MAVDYRSLDCAMATDSDKGGRINQSPCKPLIPQGSNIEGTNRSDPFIARGLLPMQAASDRRSGRPAASPLGPLQSRVKSVIAAPGSARLRKHMAGKASIITAKRSTNAASTLALLRHRSSGVGLIMNILSVEGNKNPNPIWPYEIVVTTIARLL